MRVTSWALAASVLTLASGQSPAIVSVTPDLLPAGGPCANGSPPSQCPLFVELTAFLPTGNTLATTFNPPDGTTRLPVTTGGSSITASAVATTTSGLTVLHATLPTVTGSSWGLSTIAASAAGSAPFSIRWYSIPTPVSLSPNSVTTAGLKAITMTFTAGDVLPSSDLEALLYCQDIRPISPLLVRTPGVSQAWAADAHGDTTHFIYFAKATVTTAAAASAQTVSFRTSPVPSRCTTQRVFIGYNGVHYHDTGLSLATSEQDPIKVVSLYPFLIGASPWVKAHSEARIQLSTAYGDVADARVYYEESWRVPALNDGKLVDPIYFNRAITQDNATLIICAGTQYNATTFSFVDRYPIVNFLMLSTLRRVLPYKPNLSFATGRMYEAIWYTGFVAATVSSSGHMGFLMSLNDPGSYAFVNAFLLGAREAYATGLTSLTGPPRVSAYVIGAFSDDWAEKNAASNLVYDPTDPVDILYPVTDNVSPQLLCHERESKGGAPCYTVGFNADERETLGDQVLLSAAFKLTPIYLEFIQRVITGEKAFGGDSFDGGLGVGVDVTTASPVVPLAVRTEMARRLDISKQDDTLEEVFCGTLTASVKVNGVLTPVQILDGSTGAVNGVRTAVRGQGGRWCLDKRDVYAMAYTNGPWNRLILDGVTVIPNAAGGPIYAPPPQRTGGNWVLKNDNPSLYGGLVFLGAAIAAVAVLAAVAVATCRGQDVIRFASPLFLSIIAVGGAVSGAGVLVGAVGPPAGTFTTDTCTSVLWLEGLGFALMYGSLFAKTYRVDKIFNNKKLKRLRLNVWYVVRVIAMVVAMEVGVLLALTILLKPTSLRVSIGGTGAGKLSFSVCKPTDREQYDPAMILLALHFVLLLWGAFLAYRTRNVPLGFNESRYIALSIYSVIVAAVVSFILSSSGSVDTLPSLQYVQLLVRTAVPALNTLVMVFGPKVLELFITFWYGQPGDEDGGANGEGSPASRAAKRREGPLMVCLNYMCCCCLVRSGSSRVGAFTTTASGKGGSFLLADRAGGHGSSPRADGRGSGTYGRYSPKAAGAGGSGMFGSTGSGKRLNNGSQASLVLPTPPGSLSNYGSSSSGSQRKNLYANIRAAQVMPENANVVPVTDIISEDQLAHIAAGATDGLGPDAGLTTTRAGKTRRELERGVIGPGNPTIQTNTNLVGAVVTAPGAADGPVLSSGQAAIGLVGHDPSHPKSILKQSSLTKASSDEPTAHVASSPAGPAGPASPSAATAGALPPQSTSVRFDVANGDPERPSLETHNAHGHSHGHGHRHGHGHGHAHGERKAGKSGNTRGERPTGVPGAFPTAVTFDGAGMDEEEEEDGSDNSSNAGRGSSSSSGEHHKTPAGSQEYEPQAAAAAAGGAAPAGAAKEGAAGPDAAGASWNVHVPRWLGGARPAAIASNTSGALLPSAASPRAAGHTAVGVVAPVPEAEHETSSESHGANSTRSSGPSMPVSPAGSHV